MQHCQACGCREWKPIPDSAALLASERSLTLLCGHCGAVARRDLVSQDWKPETHFEPFAVAGRRLYRPHSIQTSRTERLVQAILSSPEAFGNFPKGSASELVAYVRQIEREMDQVGVNENQPKVWLSRQWATRETFVEWCRRGLGYVYERSKAEGGMPINFNIERFAQYLGDWVDE